MDTVYDELAGGGSLKGEDAWDLLRELVLKIFSELSTARADGAQAESFEVFIWSSLQGHKIMQRYLENDIKNDPALNGSITRYILRKLGAKTNNDLLQDKLATLQAKENAMEQTIRSVKTTVTTITKDVQTLKNKAGLS